MSSLAPYTKAVVVAVGTLIAVIVAVVRGDSPDSIPGATEMLIGVLTTLFTYALPNRQVPLK